MALPPSEPTHLPIADQLRRLADQLRTRGPVTGATAPHAHASGETTAPPAADLVALLPCEPVVGIVAAACWQDGSGAHVWELVRLEDGTRISDRTAVRETFTLIAMLETLEDRLGPAALAELDGALIAWLDSWRELTNDAVGVALTTAIDAARAQVAAATDLTAVVEPRIATVAKLDTLATQLQALEVAWAALEAAANTWSEATFPDTYDHGPDAERRRGAVQVLWEALQLARRSVLREPATALLQAAREAGAALAADATVVA